ncbi:MAG: prevent-host-death family protein [Candidatus Eremiobacteraeota bacterium]|nr:prevent-host-death family protein [Candidatus Eremiobacteraeota bacterium]
MTQARTRTVGAYEAKTHLADLLDDVQRGVAVTITRRGKAVARLVPVDQKDEGRQDAIDRWLAVRHRVRPLGLTMKAAVNVGRKR